MLKCLPWLRLAFHIHNNPSKYLNPFISWQVMLEQICNKTPLEMHGFFAFAWVDCLIQWVHPLMALSLGWEPLVGLEATAGWRNMEVVSIVFVWILLENKQSSGVVLTFMSLKFNLDPFFNVNDWLKWKTELFSASEVRNAKRKKNGESHCFTYWMIFHSSRSHSLSFIEILDNYSNTRWIS